MFESITAGLVKRLGQYAGQGIHGGLRRCDTAEYPAAPAIYEELPRFRDWDAILEQCGWTVARFVKSKQNLSQSKTSQGRLVFLLARTILRGLRTAAAAGSVSGRARKIYNFFGRELEMSGLRLLLGPVAEDLLRRVLWVSKDCPDCQVAARTPTLCSFCGQDRCPIHCHCTSARPESAQQAAYWRKRLEEFIYQHPDVETIETPEDAPLDHDMFVFHTYDDDHPHFQVEVKPWWPGSGLPDNDEQPQEFEDDG